ncbi:hypothetical protein PIB30_069054, partial [Stylosanthes scabra]|nr:hypothetical protein [Stylosanthes scabra]
SYKNGFVWHDIFEDDLILPTHGISISSKAPNSLMKPIQLLPGPPSSRSHDEASSSDSDATNLLICNTPTSV